MEPTQLETPLLGWQWDQLTALGLLAGVLLMFIWGKLRYDIVAMSALMAAVVLGVVPADRAFSGFGHPAVITVALVLVLSQAIQQSGIIDTLARPLAALSDRPILFMAALCSFAALLSGFMNNVGALALLMPLAISLTDRPALVLMPLSFATILGGMTTLIGTPPNIIVSSFRQQIVGEGFGLFDFSLVGASLALIGVAFVVLIGWRLLPRREEKQRHTDVYSTHDFLTEIEVPEDSDLLNTRIGDLELNHAGEVNVIGLVRRNTRIYANLRVALIRAGDILIVRASPEELEAFLEETDLRVWGADRFEEEHLTDAEVGLLEVVVSMSSVLVGRTPKEMRFRRRHGVNLLAISREGEAIHHRLAHLSLRAGDVLLMQGSKEHIRETMMGLGCLPIAAREISISRADLRLWPVAFFFAAIMATAFGLLPISISFALALGATIITRQYSVEGLYTAIDWPIIVLLAGMIPLGEALLSTGATTQISALLVQATQGLPAWGILLAILLVTMTLSDLMNNAATAVVMAPLAAEVANKLGHSPDAFLMAVALGASCAFLTPIGHQNNLLVMGPGGYRFGDYWRMGLPVQLIIVLLGIPLLLLVWPL